MTQKLRLLVDKTLEKVLFILMAALVIDVLWQVVSRYLLQSPSTFTDELARYLLIWVSILGAAYATGKRMHIAVKLLSGRVSATINTNIEKLINLLIAGFALIVMVVGGSNLIYILLRLGNTSPALSIPVGYVYLVLPLSGLLIVFFALADFFQLQDGSRNNVPDSQGL